MNKLNQIFPKFSLLIFVSMVFVGCEHKRQIDVQKYQLLVDVAELAICDEDYRTALDNYGLAFRQIERPFGKDVYNAALAAHAADFRAERDEYLQQLVNGSDDLGYIKSTFLSNFMSVQEWDILEGKRERKYDADFRSEMIEIGELDQLFRPDYDNYDDTINALRMINLNRILEITEAQLFPAQMEMGYSENLRTQPHHIVLHHTTQRRSADKSVTDLEPAIRVAVKKGRLDPELGMQYLKFQEDAEYGRIEIYSTWQYSHPLLPDSMNYAIWVPKLSSSELEEINQIRAERYADSIEDIQTKSMFLESTDWPFILTSVNKSVANISEDITAEEAVEQYLMFTSDKVMAK
ncbi:MAG: hypothetical protein ACJAQ4_001815 [Cryomorphaceae bacterium]|jgi:hypothetical protein